MYKALGKTRSKVKTYNEKFRILLEDRKNVSINYERTYHIKSKWWTKSLFYDHDHR